MLTHPTLARLETLKLGGMAAALADQLALPEAEGLSFLERLGLLVDREETERLLPAPDDAAARGRAPRAGRHRGPRPALPPGPRSRPGPVARLV